MSLHETRMHKKRENKHDNPFQNKKNYKVSSTLLVETKISHLGKKEHHLHSKVPFRGNVLVARRVCILYIDTFFFKIHLFQGSFRGKFSHVFFEVRSFSKRFFLVSNLISPKGLEVQSKNHVSHPSRSIFWRFYHFLGKKKVFVPQTSTFSIL